MRQVIYIIFFFSCLKHSLPCTRGNAGRTCPCPKDVRRLKFTKHHDCNCYARFPPRLVYHIVIDAIVIVILLYCLINYKSVSLINQPVNQFKDSLNRSNKFKQIKQTKVCMTFCPLFIVDGVDACELHHSTSSVFPLFLN